MAKGERKKENESFLESCVPAWNDELCAEHDRTIESFEALESKISCLDDYVGLLDENICSSAGKIIATAVGAGVLTAATLGAAAPFLSAALGIEALAAGLTIASIEGGSIVLGGTAVGALTASKFIKEDKLFNIHKLYTSKGAHCIVYVNGFLQEEETSFSNWLEFEQSDSKCLYGITWGNKELSDLFVSGGSLIFNQLAKNVLLRAPSAPIALYKLLNNPWHTAVRNAERAGMILADAISRIEGTTFTLVGHSLGCRVIKHALKSLAMKKEKKIRDVMLLGGAVGNNYSRWEELLPVVSGRVVNCYSENDTVLNALYRVAQLGLSSPIGRFPIDSSDPRIINLDCKDIVTSHLEWKEQYGKIQTRAEQVTLVDVLKKAPQFENGVVQNS